MSDVIDNEPSFSEIPSDERQWAMFAHLSAFVALWLGGMAFLGPLIVWLIQRDKMKFVDDQGKEALNFQLNILALFAIGGIFAIVTLGIGLLLLIPLGIALGAVGVIFPMLAAIKANEGETYRYPYIVRVVK